MTELDPEYQDRIRELDLASSPTLRLMMTPSGPVDATGDTAGGGAGAPPELDQSKVRGILEGSVVKDAPQPREGPVTLKERQPPEVSKLLENPEAKGVLDKILKQMVGATSGEIHNAITQGTLKDLSPKLIMRSMNPAGNAIEPIAREEAEKAKLPPETVAQFTAATTFFAGLLFPGFKGKAVTAAKEVGAAAAGARAAGATETAALRARRLVRIEEATTEQARTVAGEAGALVVGDRAIKLNWEAVEPTGDLNAVLNRVADVVKDEFVAAKRGVIKDSRLATMARQAGVDVTELVARKPGQIFTVERQMAAQMVEGHLGQKLIEIRNRWRAVPPDSNEAVAIEEEARHVASLLMTIIPQVRASTSEAARVVRIAGAKMTGVQEARHQEELLRMMGAYAETLVSGLPMRQVLEHLDTYKNPQQVNVYFQTLRALLGGIAGAGGGAELGGDIGGTPGAIVGGAGGAVLGAAAAINPGVLMEAWINGLLSGSATYVVNITTEMASSVNGVIERAIAATHGSRGGPGVVPGEAMVMTHAAADYLWRSFGAYARVLTSEWGRTGTRAAVGAGVGAALSTEDSLLPNMAMGAAIGATVRPGSFLTPDQELQRRALSADGLALSGPLGRAADVVGSFMRAPSRGLVKADDYIKGMNVEMMMWALAHREAIHQGAVAGTARYREIVEAALLHPGAETMANAQEYAAYIAFQSETNRAISGAVGSNPLFRIIAPFTFTPANLLSQSFERMPLVQRASQTLRDDLAAGGAREQLARAKIDMGIALTGMAWYFAAAGVTHGHGSVNPAINKFEREVLKRDPYTFQVPGVDGLHISFNRFDPWAMHFGIVATIYEMSHELPRDEWTNYLGAVVIAGVDQWLSKSYLTGIAQFTDAATEARRGNFKAFERFGEGLAASVVPTGVGTVERVTDPTMREVDGALDAIRNRLPGFSVDLPPRLDFFGEIITAPHVGWEILDALNSFYVRAETTDAKAKAVVAEFKAKGVSVYAPDRLIGPGKPDQTVQVEAAPLQSVRLDDKQLYTLRHLFAKGVTVNGEHLKDALYSTIQSGSYRNMGPLAQKQYLTALVGQFKQLAEQELLNRDLVLAGKVRRLREQQQRLMTEPAAPKNPMGDFIKSLGR